MDKKLSRKATQFAPAPLALAVLCALAARAVGAHALAVCVAVAVKLNANRVVHGVLRGFDQFMNLVLEDTVEVVSTNQQNQLGMVVRAATSCACARGVALTWILFHCR